MLTKIPAYIDGNNLVHFDWKLNRLFVGNDSGILKIFNPDELDSEPVSLDTLEFLTSIVTFGDKVVFTNTQGKLAVLSLGNEVVGDETHEVIYQSLKPLRDAQIINEGSRIICGGDINEIIIVDLLDENKVDKLPVAENVLSFSYNSLGELVSVALANGDVLVYSVSNEKPELMEKIEGQVPPKTHQSSDLSIDYHSDHANELVCTQSLWSPTGENIYLPTSFGSIKSFTRDDWSLAAESSPYTEQLVALDLSPCNKFIALLFKNGVIHIQNLEKFALIKSLNVEFADTLPISLAWSKHTIFVGATKGELHSIQISLEEDIEGKGKTISEVEKLFLEEASDSDSEQINEIAENSKKRDALDDSMIIDEDDDEDEQDPYQYHNRPVKDILSNRRKRARFLADIPTLLDEPSYELTPYSPGSTPWIKSANASTNTTKRRYLFMNAIGYSWSVKNDSDDLSNIQKSVTISFFDRSVNKDYHFIDYYDYDLCSMNERGILLGCSGHQNETSSHKGRIFYRHHINTSDSWDRQIPLLETEYITSICITSSTSNTSGDSIIVVGTSFGYLRFFNLYGLCINIMKVSPIISLISSAINTVFSIHQSGKETYSYSIISVPDDYKFHQQECNLPIKASRLPLIKGLFFNDHSDPCLVAGHDDTLVVLSHWRETGNARWVPVLNYNNAVSDFGLTETKKNWKCWPLGLQGDKTVCLILKNNDVYPGFPLPLPIEFNLRLPTRCFKSLLANEKNNDEAEEDQIATGSNDLEGKLQKIRDDDPEEEFLRVSTLGKLLASSLGDLGDEEETMDTLKRYSLVFDKSLLKLFNSACEESRLNKAFSVVKLIKNDKALLAATKIAERHSFSNLMAKINKLREELLEMQDDEEEENEEE
ncbi:DNA polymerase alpha binding protein [Metschnikowia bicuspidata var. bicuspidata NRRL YB-4993]|uniref:DNA polymerase alpha binding protein n=1 Tax=Metschnikowia bicuspidata var. bicuspidata NRRL YB-4993 TaxID=869754 RepID=A0A1A0HKS7_9ASCO|nr:DNA polymerase alpha binding protein [Metschnikowia bicuspidata var. bicuspidata NRRL YB-4993]OBA24497.1 DNA polymerase alpha binding protein [Metschnikowia bicuspidata var. bicuspidata NRRL YB-4993]